MLKKKNLECVLLFPDFSVEGEKEKLINVKRNITIIVALELWINVDHLIL